MKGRNFSNQTKSHKNSKSLLFKNTNALQWLQDILILQWKYFYCKGFAL